jgi:hypothetical protein
MSKEIEAAGDEMERRNFFRIDDSVSLSYHAVTQDEIPERMDGMQLADNFTVMGSIASITQNMAGIMHRIAEDDPDIAAYLKAINTKIDILGRALLSSDNGLTVQPAQPVNLSASGLAFYTSEQLGSGVLLELKLLLQPSYTGIITFGEVVGCDRVDEPVGDYDHFTRVNFIHMREKDRDLLIRHVLMRQSEVLRRRREENE